MYRLNIRYRNLRPKDSRPRVEYCHVLCEVTVLPRQLRSTEQQVFMPVSRRSKKSQRSVRFYVFMSKFFTVQAKSFKFEDTQRLQEYQQSKDFRLKKKHKRYSLSSQNYSSNKKK